MNFQRSHLDCFNKPLTVDGQLGPLTNWAFAFDSLNRPAKSVITTARSCIGIKEEGTSNRSVDVDEFLAPAAVGFGHPWCCAFVSWVLMMCGQMQHETGQYFVSVYAFSNAWRERHTQNPEVGDMFIILRGGGKGHIGFVLGVEDNEIMTLEGNVRNAVRVGRRDRSKINHYVRLSPQTLHTPGVNRSAPDFDGAEDR